jgi:hypothetical protein
MKFSESHNDASATALHISTLLGWNPGQHFFIDIPSYSLAERATYSKFK